MQPFQLEIQNYDSVDVDDLPNWTPVPGEPFLYCLAFEVSEVGKIGGNYFQALVSNPEGLRFYKQDNDYGRFGKNPQRGVIILQDYSWQAVVDRLNKELQNCTRLTWQDSIECLSKKFLWEYEDYRG